jgi:hypothetical protein
VESRLRASARASRAAAKIWVAVGLVAAAGIVMAVLMRAPVADHPAAAGPVARQIEAVKPAPVPGPRVLPSRRHTSAPQPDRMTSFLTLPGSEAFPEPTATSILRVQFPRSDLRLYGLEVSPSVTAEFVRADFLVGDDGLARAVRFVN